MGEETSIVKRRMKGSSKMVKVTPSEITPESLYHSRRTFITSMGALLATSLALSACDKFTGTQAPVPGKQTAAPEPGAPTATALPTAGAGVDELGNALTAFQAITNYTNFYEFTTSKESVASVAKDFRSRPWTVEVGGLVQKPRTFDIDEILKYSQEERIYRMRCVEAWSMVIPWLGFPLSKLLNEVEPMSQAKFVRFETLYDPEQMRGQRGGPYDWPYVEGLRVDEALHELAILSTGLYGKELLPQNGAPLRLVVPWKYGFKSIKSIVKIELVEKMPVSLWMSAAPDEYGFYANVNPAVNHPLWLQATERRIGEPARRPTLLFNGYADDVAQLYAGMDLRVNF